MRDMSIVAIFYLLLIMGWIFLILVLKCKRARAKRLAEEEAQQQIHVIQIGNSYYDLIPVGSAAAATHSCSTHTSRSHLNTIEIDSPTFHQSTTTHTNPAFVADEGGVFPASSAPNLDLPPSYEEVMRLPRSFPKLAPVATAAVATTHLARGRPAQTAPATISSEVTARGGLHGAPGSIGDEPIVWR